RLEAAQVEEATAGGGIVLDASAERSEAPLVFPGLNDEKLDEHPDARHYALPTPLAAQLATVLLPLEAKVRVRSVEAVALLPAAGAGVDGIDELSRQTIDLLSGREPPRKVFGHRLAFNLVPLVGRMGEAAQTGEEVGTLEQAGRLLGRAIAGHLVATWVPLFHGSTLFVTVRTARPRDPGGPGRRPGRAPPRQRGRRHGADRAPARWGGGAGGLQGGEGHRRARRARAAGRADADAGGGRRAHARRPVPAGGRESAP